MLRSLRAVLATSASMGIAVSLVTVGVPAVAHAQQSTSPEARQKDKNTMRNLAVGLGALAAQQATKGNTTSAVVLGAGAAYAGKKYEDARKAQTRDNDDRRVGRYDRYDRYDGRRDDRYDDRYDDRRDDRRDDRYDSRYENRRDEDCDDAYHGGERRSVAQRFSDTRGRKLGHQKQAKASKPAKGGRGNGRR